jgi:hypothetical protein
VVLQLAEVPLFNALYFSSGGLLVDNRIVDSFEAKAMHQEYFLLRVWTRQSFVLQ